MDSGDPARQVGFEVPACQKHRLHLQDIDMVQPLQVIPVTRGSVVSQSRTSARREGVCVQVLYRLTRMKWYTLGPDDRLACPPSEVTAYLIVQEWPGTIWC